MTPSDDGPIPERVAVRMHRVGFGDCFLLSFGYASALGDGRSERHVLIDFGTTSLATRPVPLANIAEAIGERTSGELDCVIVSHRHRDHLSAFASPDIVETLEATTPPKLVVRPWTEHPDADADFTGVGGGPGADSLAFVHALRDARTFAATMAEQVTTRSARGLPRELRSVAMVQLANEEAVDQLHAWAGNDGEYLHYGMRSRIEELIPGVTVHVLGPPTIEQHPAVNRQRDADPEEFWMLYRRLAEQLPQGMLRALAEAQPGAAPPRTERAGLSSDPGPVRWLTERLDHQQLGSFLRIVRLMDDVLNNTSLILVFEVEGPGVTRRLLFPGDAQIENWEYALKVADVERNRALLGRVDLYKVGHHGSRNATPRTLFDLWNGPEVIDHPLVSMMSTKSGVHGHHVETAVPRTTLVAALDGRGDLFDSERFEETWVEVAADMASATRFLESARGG